MNCTRLSLSVAMFALVLPCGAFAAERVNDHPVFSDPGGRLVTIESWASAAGLATAWAVYPDRIVTYSCNDFGKPQRILAEHLLDAAALTCIQEEVERLPPGMRGKRFGKKDVFDGRFLRVSFSPKGELTKDCIELDNIFMPEVVPLLSVITSQIKSGPKIDYTDEIGARFKDLETVSEDVYRP